MEVVCVEHEFEYTTKNGRHISIKPNESFLLIAKTNEHWWHVRKDLDSKSFYVPAQYMKNSQVDKENAKEISVLNSTEEKSEKCALKDKNTLMPPRSSFGQKYRFSTFGLCLPDDDDPIDQVPPVRSSIFAHNLNKSSSNSDASDFSLYAKPQPKLEGHKQSKNTGNEEVKLQVQPVKHKLETMEDDSFEFPDPPTPTLFPEDELPNLNQESETKSGSNEAQTDDIIKKKETGKKSETTARPATPPLRKKVDNDHTAVYVNVAQVRKSISALPPSAPPSFSPSSPSFLDPEGWEVHFDQDSGQDYYYHPATGQTTWDNPFTDSSPSELKPHPHSPSPPQTPPISPASPSSDWEELVDERSGQTYFYNPMSGETSWDPPMMEPMSVHRFHEDGPVREDTMLLDLAALSCFRVARGNAAKMVSLEWFHIVPTYIDKFI